MKNYKDKKETFPGIEKIEEKEFDKKYDTEKLPAYDLKFTSNWQALARAIVEDAAKEYASKSSAYWYRTHYMDENGVIRTREAARSSEKREMERNKRWFRTHWAEMLIYFGTDGGSMEGAYITDKLDREIDKRNRRALKKKYEADQKKKLNISVMAEEA